jgi:hypothetical protein
MNFTIVANVSEFFEAVDPDQRDRRIKSLQSKLGKLSRLGNINDKGAAEKYRSTRSTRDRLRSIISKHRIPGGLRNGDYTKVTFKNTDRFKNRKTRSGTAAQMQGYMHNPGATMHVARKMSSGRTKWYKAP